jgi:predicted nucleotidyltransferase
MSSEDVEAIKQSLKRGAAALRDAGVPFVVGGGLASWARGGPESGHDVDFLVKPEDAEVGWKALGEAGMRLERPPEGWLFKAHDGEVLIDLIFAPSGLEMTDDLFDRADDIEVLAQRMRVLSLEDLMITKLACLREHEVDYDAHLEIARSLREQIDWADVRRRSPENPYVAAFFTLAEGLGLVPPAQS